MTTKAHHAAKETKVHASAPEAKVHPNLPDNAAVVDAIHGLIEAHDACTRYGASKDTLEKARETLKKALGG